MRIIHHHLICFTERLAGKRFQSSYAGSLSRRASDPESIIRAFESQPALHNSPAAVAEYVKALVKVDRLDQSKLLQTLQRGLFWLFYLF